MDQSFDFALRRVASEVALVLFRDFPWACAENGFSRRLASRASHGKGREVGRRYGGVTVKRNVFC
jgi:hypothetical protein